MYIILGIGADDIFVLFDAFQQSPRQHGSAYRLSWALRRAVSAMAVTSFTTFAAFVVTALSPITNIKVSPLCHASSYTHRLSNHACSPASDTCVRASRSLASLRVFLC